MTNESERAAFEKWAAEYGHLLTRWDSKPDDYMKFPTQDAWIAWQARAQIIAEQEKAEPVAWRWRDNVRPGLDWYLSDNADWAKQLGQTTDHEVEPLYLHPAPSPAEAVSKYQSLCAAMYQVAGVYDMPTKFLDALFDAAQGEIEKRQETDDLLPYYLPESGAAKLVDTLKLEAQIHAQEARTANATIAEIYQLCTGSIGEPGNWHGAEPVRKMAEAAKRLRALEMAMGEVDGWHTRRFKKRADEIMREQALRATPADGDKHG